MIYKIIELTLQDRGILYIVSPVDCVEVDIMRFNKESVVKYHVYSDQFSSIANAWHYIGKILDERKTSYVFAPNRINRDNATVNSPSNCM